MDCITLQGLTFHGHHGCLTHEQENGQTFVIDLSLHADLTKPCKSDSLEDTINYAAVFTTVQRIVTQKRFNLIECLAEVICQTLFKDFDALKSITICVKKPEAPLEGTFEYTAVTLNRKRS